MEWVKTLRWVEKELENIYEEEKKYKVGMYDDKAPVELLDRYLSACIALEGLVETAKEKGKINYLKKQLLGFPHCAYEIAQEFEEFEDLLSYISFN